VSKKFGGRGSDVRAILVLVAKTEVDEISRVLRLQPVEDLRGLASGDSLVDLGRVAAFAVRDFLREDFQ